MLFVDLLGSIPLPGYPRENSVPFDERTIVGGTRTPSQKGAAIAALREMRGPLSHDLEPLPIQECELAVGPATKDLLLDGLPGPRVPLVRIGPTRRCGLAHLRRAITLQDERVAGNVLSRLIKGRIGTKHTRCSFPPRGIQRHARRHMRRELIIVGRIAP